VSDVKYQFAGLLLEMIISAGAKTAGKIVLVQLISHPQFALQKADL